MTTPLIVAYGAGVDSTAVLVGLHHRHIRPDLILFADTGGEKPETYAFLWQMQAWLESVGFPTTTIVRYHSPIAGDQSLYGECFRKSVLPGLAYGGKQCSLKWKADPQHRYVKRWPPAIAAWAAGEVVVRAIGYDDSPRDQQRACNARQVTAQPGYQNWFPLQEWHWSREECQQQIAGAGLEVPPKSACYFCPATKKDELHALALKHPDLVDAALALEARAQAHGLRSIRGLGRRWAWGDYLHIGGDT